MGGDHKLTGPDLTQGIDKNDVADGAMLLGHAGGESVLLARRGAEVFAIGATCTHYGGPLAEGLLVGDTVHNFCDGVIIAAAFLADAKLGLVTALAIMAHEIPQEAGDYIVLLNAGFSRGKALLFNAVSGLAAVAGGVLGYFVVGPWSQLMPYLLVVASSSFVYVAVADLLPQLQQRLTWRETVAQVAWLAAGLGLVVMAMAGLKGYGV